MRALLAVATVIVAMGGYSQGIDLTGVGASANAGAEVVVDAIRLSAQTDIAVQAAGFFRDGKIAGGPDADALNRLLAYPGEEIYVLELTGEQIRKAMERSLSLLPQANRAFLQISGMSVVMAPSAPAQSRVKRILVGGKMLDPTAKYTVAAPATLARGALGYFTCWSKDTIVKETGVTVEAAVKSHLAGKRSWPLGEKDRIEGS